ncbi:hypothetical protein FKP32DRAFT_1602832 [Trametes sanguinea]|nr:hypothetical protein FKP32DRAFT_1602832 [Trametes sanguinea]
MAQLGTNRRSHIKARVTPPVSGASEDDPFRTPEPEGDRDASVKSALRRGEEFVRMLNLITFVNASENPVHRNYEHAHYAVFANAMKNAFDTFTRSPLGRHIATTICPQFSHIANGADLTAQVLRELSLSANPSWATEPVSPDSASRAGAAQISGGSGSTASVGTIKSVLYTSLQVEKSIKRVQMRIPDFTLQQTEVAPGQGPVQTMLRRSISTMIIENKGSESPPKGHDSEGRGDRVKEMLDHTRQQVLEQATCAFSSNPSVNELGVIVGVADEWHFRTVDRSSIVVPSDDPSPQAVRRETRHSKKAKQQEAQKTKAAPKRAEDSKRADDIFRKRQHLHDLFYNPNGIPLTVSIVKQPRRSLEFMNLIQEFLEALHSDWYTVPDGDPSTTKPEPLRMFEYMARADPNADYTYGQFAPTTTSSSNEVGPEV